MTRAVLAGRVHSRGTARILRRDTLNGIVVLGWSIVVGLNAAAVALAAAAWRADVHARMRRWLRLLWAIVVAGLALPMPWAVLGFVRVRDALAGRYVDPSEKARVLAETISEAMNLTALVVLTTFAPFCLAVVLSFVAHRRRKREQAIG